MPIMGSGKDKTNRVENVNRRKIRKDGETENGIRENIFII